MAELFEEENSCAYELRVHSVISLYFHCRPDRELQVDNLGRKLLVPGLVCNSDLDQAVYSSRCRRNITWRSHRTGVGLRTQDGSLFYRSLQYSRQCSNHNLHDPDCPDDRPEFLYSDRYVDRVWLDVHWTTCTPVSYTHLDVYKRQVLHSGQSGHYI